jgi:ADP-heptose:LPS heptosyltransferase
LTFKAQKKTNPYPKHVKKILLIRRNRLGDAINLLPIINAIKKNYPDIEISVLANKYNAQIFEYCSAINSIHTLNEKSWLGQNFLFINPLIWKLKKENFDLTIAVGDYSSKLAKITYFIKPKYSVGIGSGRFFFDLIYDKALIVNKNKFKSQLSIMIYLFRNAGLKLPNKLPYASLEILNTPNNRWLAICPDVDRIESQYPPKQLEEVIKKLTQKKIFKKIVIFTRSSGIAYKKLSIYGVKNIQTKNLHQFIKMLSKFKFVISAEGGSAHISGALGLYVCIISGTKNQNHWNPHAKYIKILNNSNSVKEISSDSIVDAIVSFQ